MKEPITAIVARRLDALMKADGELSSQQKLAKRAHIGQTTIGRIRRGEVSATVENLKAIADVFGITVGELCGEGHLDLPPPRRWPLNFDPTRLTSLNKARLEGYAARLFEEQGEDEQGGEEKRGAAGNE